MTQQTISETLFELYCHKHTIPCSRISTESHKRKRTPDYQVILQDNTVISEVKQFDPTKEEKRLQIQLNKQGFTESFGGEPGQRASKKITKSMKQLQSLGKDKYPTLLVLFNNVSITNRHVHPYAIKTAMYGLEEVVLALPHDAATSPWVIDRKFGGRRKVTPSQNTTLSAIAVLYENHDGGSPFLNVFHNVYAALDINPEWLRNPETRHFKLSVKDQGKFQKWIEV